MVKTPHRLIHDAKEAGVITEEEWRAFMRARNVADKQWRRRYDGYFFSAKSARAVLSHAFSYNKSMKGVEFWCSIHKKLRRFEASNQEPNQ